MPLEDILTPTRPFGPIDQTKIDDPQDAVDILDLFEPLSNAVSGNHTLIYGRKGCGKSAAISIFQGFKHAERRLSDEGVHIQDVYGKSIFIAIPTWTKFLDMNTHVHKQLLDLMGLSSGKIADYELIPTEEVERIWIDQLWEEIFRRLYDQTQEGQIAEAELPSVIMCFNDDAMSRMRGTPEYIASKLFVAAKSEVKAYLERANSSICILFDSMEKYPIFNRTFGLSMSGFLRAINTLSQQDNRIRIVFTLPEELLPSFRAHSENILKDFENAYPMRWKPRDLLRIAAHRYRLFLVIRDPHWGNKLKNRNLHASNELNFFYQLLFPDHIKNEIGVDEPPVSYILRHTYLLPRHLLICLNKIAVLAHNETGGWRKFSAAAVVDGVKATEGVIADEIMQPYDAIYRNIKRELNSVLGELPPIFQYGDLQKCIGRIRRHYDLQMDEMMQLLFKMGLVGRVAQEQVDKIYTLADFYFNFAGNVSFSGADTLCFHPVFSRFFNASRLRNGDVRVIYPRGVSPDF